jgi:hypothetical protein
VPEKTGFSHWAEAVKLPANMAVRTSNLLFISLFLKNETILICYCSLGLRLGEKIPAFI